MHAGYLVQEGTAVLDMDLLHVRGFARPALRWFHFSFCPFCDALFCYPGPSLVHTVTPPNWRRTPVG